MSKFDKTLAIADPRQRAWIEVDACAIEANARILRSLIAQNCLLMAVVKADGYGHGAETVAKAALRGGAQNLGVATLQEGIQLRQAGLNCPILLLGNLTKTEEFETCIQCDLMPTLSSFKEAILCENIAKSFGLKFSIHLKVDTGMSRLGCDFKEALALIKTIDNLENLLLKGIYSHLALADDSFSKVTKQQQQKFDELISTLSQRSKKICYHLANSAGTLRDQKLHYDMVRVGLALYGYNPISNLENEISLRPALSVKAKVTLIREVPKGIGVSYGHRFITKRATRLAVVGIGYADGVTRALSGRMKVLINSRLLPQVGAITMDQLVVDATDHDDVEVGNVVTLLGCDGANRITTQQWSEWSGSIPWEVLCGFKNRLPRIEI